MSDEPRKGRISPVDEAQLLRAAACDWRLSRGDVGVYAVILQHADEDGHAFPGPTRIGQLAHLAVSNVKKSLKHLEDLKYIYVHRPGPRRANRYVVQDPPTVPSRKRAKAIREVARDLGTHASLALGTKSSPVHGR